MKLRNIILSTVLLATFSACEDLFEPAKENNRGVEEMLTDPYYAVGLLGYGYAMLPYENTSVSDVATAGSRCLTAQGHLHLLQHTE